MQPSPAGLTVRYLTSAILNTRQYNSLQILCFAEMIFSAKHSIGSTSEGVQSKRQQASGQVDERTSGRVDEQTNRRTDEQTSRQADKRASGQADEQASEGGDE